MNSILDPPRAPGTITAAYDIAGSIKLVQMFVDNFAQYETHVDQDVREVALQA